MAREPASESDIEFFLFQYRIDSQRQFEHMKRGCRFDNLPYLFITCQTFPLSEGGEKEGGIRQSLAL